MGDRICRVLDLGRLEYAEAERLQERLVEARRAGEVPDTLLLVEHEPVVTLGSGSSDAGEGLKPKLINSAGVEVRRVSRGGRATFHGPGQLVGYPILDLRHHLQDLHWYLRSLEQVLIDALAQVGCNAERKDGLTGVWIRDRKVASIGIAVRGWITWHGFALNLDCDRQWWRLLDPCGLSAGRMASLTELCTQAPSREAVAESVVQRFGEVFRLNVVESDRTELFRASTF